MREYTPDCDDCQKKWESMGVGEQLQFTWKLARLLEQQRDEARFVAYGLTGGKVGRRIKSKFDLTKVWGNHYKRMAAVKIARAKERKNEMS